ncbi:SCO2322 family protein [Streptomyces sp. CA-250714]|uniref:SCO2322 family protein n=1 Tax=Streptomyces sp. CA-250714 TaxID=3240060 RepID=UPI003D8D7231
MQAAVLTALFLLPGTTENASATATAPAPATTVSATAATWAAAHPAANTDGYRYWSFWHRKEDGSWSYATEGPATERPADGDTLGFRFALSENSQQADKPRGAVTFADACAKTTPKAGSKRVAVRIDFGTRADAPEGEPKSPPAPHTGCARIPANGTAADALTKVATPLRYNSQALLCAIDHYPAKGCGEQAKENSKSEQRDGSGSGDGRGESEGGKAGNGGQDDGISTGLGVTAGVAAVGILGAAALWQARRRRH